ncbi:MAG: GNAT family N-acetyltransferase [Dehalococcoidia bacterium]|nr:GNAT family N-acetyltransferase [Dehalococcoidia bacterium]
MDPDVTDNTADQQYELQADDLMAVLKYRLETDRIALVSTRVPPELGGQGVGTRLIRAALADARERGLLVVPICPFVKAHLEKFPEEASTAPHGT